MTALPPLALAYHGVADVPLAEDPDALFVRPAALEAQVRLLQRRGYRTLPFGDLADRVARGEGEGFLALTFDDGFAADLENLVPVLERTGAVATVFVVPGLYGRPHPTYPSVRCLTAEQVQALGRHVEIGSHTVRHLDLTTLSAQEQRAELRDSRDALEQLLQRTVDTVAYPLGRADAVTLDAAQEAGYRAGCLTSAAGAWDRPLELPRQDMGNGATRLGLRLKQVDRYEPLLRLLPARALRRGVRVLKARLPASTTRW